MTWKFDMSLIDLRVSCRSQCSLCSNIILLADTRLHLLGHADLILHWYHLLCQMSCWKFLRCCICICLQYWLRSIRSLNACFLTFLCSFNEKDHGIFRDGSKEVSEAQHQLCRRTLLQDLNRQGAVVLEGRTLGNVFFWHLLGML